MSGLTEYDMPDNFEQFDMYEAEQDRRERIEIRNRRNYEYEEFGWEDEE